ncbi:MAG: hypothetical protein H7Y31_01935, partial [Chitinophagaceae bacterium]|nr:hypothetical protein [Chitinophagaceae bacterium]
PFLMKDSTVVTCDKVFMDPGGVDKVSEAVSRVATLLPSGQNNRVRITFSQFKISDGSFRVYNGTSTSAPLLGSYSTYNPPTTLEGLNPTGGLTIHYQAYGTTDSGWTAQISCYNVVAPPTNVNVSVQSSQKLLIAWADNADDETKYILERSINAPRKFSVLAELPFNHNSYLDTTAPFNSVIFYRVRAVRDTMSSFYAGATFNYGNAPYLMADSTVSLCDRIFMDAGGVDLYHETSNSNKTTLKPLIAGHRLRVTFSRFKIGYGYLQVYNGSNEYSPYLGDFSSSNPPTVLEGTSADGSLTFIHTSYNSLDSGWVATVQCYKLVAKPTLLRATNEGQTVRLSWTDNADDETKYIVERSVNAPSLYYAIAELPANAMTFVDSNAINNALIYYRIVAVRDTMKSPYSDAAIVAVEDAPLIMKDTSLITCNKVFLDPGGIDKYSSSSINNVVTFRANPGYRVRVVFTKFQLGSGATLRIHNGPSTGYGYSSHFGSSLPWMIEGNNPEGALTFAFFNSSGSSDSGWHAQVTCYKVVADPTNLTAVADSEKRVLLQWTDKSDDESNFIIERSFDGVNFSTLTSLPANTNNFRDSSAMAASIVSYRITAQRDTIFSKSSNVAALLFGPSVTMTNTTITNCGISLLDPGGTGLYNNSINVSTTIIPAVPGTKLRIVFTSFRTEGCCDHFSIYNGPSTSSPFMARYSGVMNAPSMQSTAADGSLTFNFSTDGSGVDSGFVAHLFCVSTIERPTGLTTSLNNGRVQLQWNDPNTQEIGFKVERSVGTPNNFKLLAHLPANATSFIDTKAVLNAVQYYRVRTFDAVTNSGYSDTANMQMLLCQEPATTIAQQSSSNYTLLNGTTTIFDAQCNMLAKIIGTGTSSVKGVAKTALWIDETPMSAAGITFGNRHFEISPDSNANLATGDLKLYFKQSEFDNFNSTTIYSKLPANSTDQSRFKNIRIWIAPGTSNDGSGHINSYPYAPQEVDSSKTTLIWNNTLSCWELSVAVRGFGGIFFSSASDTLTTCIVAANNPAITSFRSSLSGATYTWQKLDGANWINLTNGSIFTGVNTAVLQGKTFELYHNDQFRCLVNGQLSKKITLSMAAYWLGTQSGDWGDPLNWTCGVVPGRRNDIIVEGGKSYYPNVVSVNRGVRSLTIRTGGRVMVSSGGITVEKPTW